MDPQGPLGCQLSLAQRELPPPSIRPGARGSSSLRKHQQSSGLAHTSSWVHTEPHVSTPSPGRGGRGSLALLRSSDGEMDDTGFLQVQHTLKDHFRFFSSKRGFLEAELEAVSVNWGDGNGREENGAVVMGRAARALHSAAFLVCNSCKLTPLQLFIRVCSSSETLLPKQAFICIWFFLRAQKLAVNQSPALPRTKSKRSGRNTPSSCQALH